jgi:hypothetical protein
VKVKQVEEYPQQQEDAGNYCPKDYNCCDGIPDEDSPNSCSKDDPLQDDVSNRTNDQRT